VHANAIEIDSDGNILVSVRHFDEITKIDFNTGNIIWRFGINAANNQFTFVNDPMGFSHQHDIRKLANGNYTVYDNGNLHVPQYSQALEYHLDETAMEATLVWDYQHDPSIFAPLTGSNQRMPNNNRMIGWGGTSPVAITEVNSGNQVVFELNLPDSVTGYRARKYDWQTTLFSTEQNIYFGNYEGSSSPKKYLLQVNNNYSQTISIYPRVAETQRSCLKCLFNRITVNSWFLLQRLKPLVPNVLKKSEPTASVVGNEK
jgi:hypothetical protein